MAAAQPVRLILASASPARRELLEQAGYAFTVIPAHIDEPTEAVGGDIRRYVQETAWRKAAAVAGRVGEGIVIAADSVGWLNGRVIGKPEDAADAERIVRALAGTEHELWTGVTLWRRPDGLQVGWQEVSRVAMKPLSDAELAAYVASGAWAGKSGAYAIREDDPFVWVAAGSFSNVVGLPMESLARALTWLAAAPSL
jgi:septum formation protein